MNTTLVGRLVFAVSISTLLALGNAIGSASPLQTDSLPRQLTPCELLQAGKPDEALKIMKADPSWINRPNELMQTPLYFAAEHDQIEIVKWLLQNNADVNAQAYNRHTPLHMTENPDIIALMLNHHPDLRLYAGPGTDPFHNAVDRYFSAEVASEKKQWADIIEQFRAAGADYDLLTAIRFDDLKRVKEILTTSPEIGKSRTTNSFSRDGKAFRLAVSTGAIEIARYLIETDHIDVREVTEGDGISLLIDAVRHPKMVRLLIEKGVKDHPADDRHAPRIISALHCSIFEGATESTRLLLDNGSDSFELVGSGELAGFSALEIAAVFGKADHAAAILDHASFKNADEEQRNELLNKCLTHAISIAFWNWTPTRGDHARLLQSLIDAGADPQANRPMEKLVFQIRPPFGPTEDGKVSKNSVLRSMALILVENGVEYDLLSATAFGDEQRVSKILALETSQPDANRSHPRALSFAVKMNDVGITKQLIEAGTSVDASAKSDPMLGRTPLHIAAMYNSVEVAKVLIDAGANINITNESLETPLHLARPFFMRNRDANLKLIRLLLENGADPNARNASGETPLEAMLPSDAQTVNGVKQLFAEFETYQDRTSRKNTLH